MKRETPFITVLRCLCCGREYAPGQVEYVCGCRPNVGSDLGTLDVGYDYDAVRRAISPERIAADPDRSIARYWPLLPMARRESLPPLPVGNTPLLHARRLGASIGLPHLHLKDEGRNPSASLKDRASAVAVALARESGQAIIATASTGNAAAALSGQCAAAGQANVIFVPRTAPQAKVAQLLVHGSTVLAVDGSYDQAFDLCTGACRAFGWYNRNTGYNPYMTEGKKTVAYEIAQQLGELRGARGVGALLAAPARRVAGRGSGGAGVFQPPDAVFVSVGDGCIIGGVHKGFAELLALGWAEKMPRLYGVQAQGSAALANAWRDGLEVPEPVQATTRADSISVNAPRDAVKALNAVRRTGGAFVTVPDEEILAAILPLARDGAVFAEPAGAAAYAGLLRALEQGLVRPDETVVAICTGSGLKDIDAAIQVAGGTTVIAPTLEALESIFNL